MLQPAISVHNRETKMVTTKRSDGGQFTGLIFLLMVLGTIVWGGSIVLGWMKDPNRLPLSWLMVTGVRHYTTNDDIRQAILTLGAPGIVMAQDINVIQQQIERLPWIKQVRVRKKWPDELKIHVVEYVPVARWNDLYMLDNSGKVFSVPAENIGNQPIPMLYGPEGKEQEILTGYRIMNEILATAQFQLKAVSMNARHSWQLTLKDDTRLKLGRDDRTKRLQRFIEIYPVLLQQVRNNNKRIDYVDLRYDSGLAVGWASTHIEPKNSNQ